MAYLKRQWFILALLLVLVAGFIFCDSLRGFAEIPALKWSVVMVTMFLMAWPLELKAIIRTVRRPLAPLLATGVNLIFVPLLAWPFASFLGTELGAGLIVAAATPTTLATASVWTRHAGGDDSISMMVTLITNSLCFFVTPLWVFGLTGNEIPVELMNDTILKLLLFVVVPIFVAQLVRVHRPSATWAVAKKPTLSVMALMGVLVMTGLGAIGTGVRMSEAAAAGERLFELNQLLLMFVVVFSVHGIALVVGGRMARTFGLPRESEIAVALSGSQKTLMIGLSTAINLGVSIIPMIAYHTLQLIWDALVADRFRQKSAALAAEDHAQSGAAAS